jgi:DNA polymerase III subunit alpha
VVNRLDFELETIKSMGYPGYFLIVQDFINEAREMGVLVGPGRGSAAGAAVSYCTGITNIDPIKVQPAFRTVPESRPYFAARCGHRF